ncbi:MAG: HAMP domain-containing histidine kinase [Deltaproteobacteria bacterium]|nr:HAMP domain-containing histidine kinase [Deltaproteobacteria bacterium]
MGQFEQEMLDYVKRFSPMAVLFFDNQGKVVKANAFVQKILGDGIIGRNFSEIFVDFQSALNLENLALESDQEHLLHLNTPSKMPESLFFRFYRQGGQVLAMGHTPQDENEILRRNLQEISAELSNVNRELNKRNAELDWLNDQKNRFLGIAAHDLRSPIGHILISSSFLIEEIDQYLNPEQTEFLNIIRDSSKFMLDLIDDLLDLAAIEAGKLNLNPAPVDLVELLRRNVQLNQLLADKRGLSLVLECCETLPPINLDQSKIQQVMNNLLSNAIKYSPSRGHIVVSLFKSDHDVIVSVRDQGPGIPSTEINKLFQPFSKTNMPAPGGEKSTGLGLSIARRIVTGHGGRMWVDSREGQGAAFFFSLPMVSLCNEK